MSIGIDNFWGSKKTNGETRQPTERKSTMNGRLHNTQLLIAEKDFEFGEVHAHHAKFAPMKLEWLLNYLLWDFPIIVTFDDSEIWKGTVAFLKSDGQTTLLVKRGNLYRAFAFERKAIPDVRKIEVELEYRYGESSMMVGLLWHREETEPEEDDEG